MWHDNAVSAETFYCIKSIFVFSQNHLTFKGMNHNQITLNLLLFQKLQKVTVSVILQLNDNKTELILFHFLNCRWFKMQLHWQPVTFQIHFKNDLSPL